MFDFNFFYFHFPIHLIISKFSVVFVYWKCVRFQLCWRGPRQCDCVARDHRRAAALALFPCSMPRSAPRGTRLPISWLPWWIPRGGFDFAAWGTIDCGLFDFGPTATRAYTESQLICGLHSSLPNPSLPPNSERNGRIAPNTFQTVPYPVALP